MKNNKMTVFEIHLALCIETVDIWNNPNKMDQLPYADMLDDCNQIIEPHALNNTFPTDNEWNRFINGLEYYKSVCRGIVPIIRRAKKLSTHPEYFDAELNNLQYIAYRQSGDKSCIEYYTNQKK